MFKISDRSRKENSYTMKNNYKILTDDDSKNISMLIKSILVGIAAGSVAVLFRIVLTYAEQISFIIYDFVSKDLHFIPILLVGLCILGYFVAFLVSKNPFISGSGIPQVKGILSGHFRDRKSWVNTLCTKFIGGTVAILGGLSLGREGPSIQLGASIAEGIGNKIGKNRLERKVLMASGASAGLAAAFNAPMAGVIFALEEIFKYFSPIILLSTMSAAVVADFISKQIFGIEPIFKFTTFDTIPLENYWIIIILGIVLGLLGVLYNFIILKTQKFFKMSSLPSRVKFMIPFMIAGILGIIFPVVLGGGHRALEELNLSSGIKFLIIIFVVKFVFSMISFGSGAPGGIFFPLLILGGTIGAVFAKISINYFGYDEALFYNFVILAMAGYFTAIVKAPITGIVLVMEMTGSFTHMLSLTVVSITAYMITDLFKSPPIYDALLDNLISNENVNEEVENSKKVMIEIIVQHGSLLENKQIKSIKWPRKMLLVYVKRGTNEILPKGDTELKVGDYLLILTDINSESKIREKLEEINNV